jgi:hypothetical protein
MQQKQLKAFRSPPRRQKLAKQLNALSANVAQVSEAIQFDVNNSVSAKEAQCKESSSSANGAQCSESSLGQG